MKLTNAEKCISNLSLYSQYILVLQLLMREMDLSFVTDGQLKLRLFSPFETNVKLIPIYFLSALSEVCKD